MHRSGCQPLHTCGKAHAPSCSAVCTDVQLPAALASHWVHLPAVAPTQLCAHGPSCEPCMPYMTQLRVSHTLWDRTVSSATHCDGQSMWVNESSLCRILLVCLVPPAELQTLPHVMVPHASTAAAPHCRVRGCCYAWVTTIAIHQHANPARMHLCTNHWLLCATH